jgi:hypothetical protein
MTACAGRAVRVTVLVAVVAVGSGCGASRLPTGPGAARTARTAPRASTAALPSSTASIPGSLLSEARPIGTGPRFTLPVTGPVAGRCQRSLGPRIGVHVEVFAANRVLLPAGIGARPPWTKLDGRIVGASCYGALVTLDPTGLVLVRPGSLPTLADLFRAWGEPLSRSRLTSFTAAKGSQVAVFVNGRLWRGAPSEVPLTRHAEIVLEVGPHVPPHSSYAFPPGT